MKLLRLYFRIRQRQNSDTGDYFQQIKEKYGSELTYSEIDTIYFAIDQSEAAKLRDDQHFLIAQGNEGPSLVIKEMIGEIPVENADDAESIANEFDDHVYAEFVHKMYFDRGPV